MATEKKANYTTEQTASILAAYAKAPSVETVEALAKELGKTPASIRMKLVREGVYQKKEYTTKTGEKVQPKRDLADAIGAVLKLAEADITSLEKASKNALQAVWKALANSKPVAE